MHPGLEAIAAGNAIMFMPHIHFLKVHATQSLMVNAWLPSLNLFGHMPDTALAEDKIG